MLTMMRVKRCKGAFVCGISVLTLFALVLCLLPTLQLPIGSSSWPDLSFLSFPTAWRDKELFTRQRSAAAQCHSRGEYGRYLPPPPAPPSLALWKALSTYERLHARCLTLSDLNATSLSNVSCKYLLYLEGHEGVGNRLISVVSAFLYALLSDRVLLIDSRGHLASLLCQPFPASSWVAPPSFPYAELLAAATDPHKRSWVYHAELYHNQSPAQQQFWNVSVQERLVTVPWLAWSSNQYLVPRFFAMPSMWPRLVTLFPSQPSLAFSHLARYLLLPADEAWERVVNAYEGRLSGSNVSVGLQVRPHFVKPKGAFKREVLDRLLECLATCMMAARPLETQAEVAILVASLQGRYYAEMKSTLMKPHPNGSAPLVTIHTLSQENRQRHTWDQALKAFVEMWVLSLCDELATSSWSTFGYVARGLRGRPSWLLNIRADQLEGSAKALEVCSLQQSSDPCNHYPFLAKADVVIGHPSPPNTSSTMDTWSRRHLSRCGDESNGIQLLDG